jgi:hypothetical protein
METVKKMRVTKTSQIHNHLLAKKSITSLQAIEMFGATRLSAVIFNLRKRGFDISTTDVTTLDRNNNKVTFAKYYLNETINKN